MADCSLSERLSLRVYAATKTFAQIKLSEFLKEEYGEGYKTRMLQDLVEESPGAWRCEIVVKPPNKSGMVS